MVDLFILSPGDGQALDTLFDRLAAHCDTVQVEQFRAAFAHRHRIQHRREPTHAYEDARRALAQR